MRKMLSALSLCLLSVLATAVVLALTLVTSTSGSRPLPVAAGYSQQEGMDTTGGILTAGQPTTTTDSTIFMPAVIRDYRTCSPESPFGLSIAALHQVVPGEAGGHTREVLTEAQWLALYEEAFPTLVAALKESGACWTSVRVDWSWIQPDPPPAAYVWGPYHDEKLALVAESGAHLIAHIDGVPEWAGPHNRGPIYDDRLDEFSQFLTDLVNRYKQSPYNIRTWDLFNEPDWTKIEPDDPAIGWGRNGDKYGEMAAVAYAAIKAADPTAMVIMGGIAYDGFLEYDGSFYRYFSDEVMEAGGDEYMDVLNFHYFPDFAPEWERWVPEGYWPTCGIVDDGLETPYPAFGIDVIAKANHFRNRMSVCHSVNKPVWLTELGEHGYPGNPDSLARQSRYVIQGNTRALAAGIDKVVWFVLVSPPYDPHAQGLLYQDDWSPKPAYYTYQVLAGELAGYTYSHTRTVPEVEAYVFRTEKGPEKTTAWGSGTLAFTPASRLRVVDRMGNVSFVDDGGAGDVDAAQNGSVVLQMTVDPVFVSVQ
jgi:hypothetical protein